VLRNSVCRNDNRHIDNGTVIVNKTLPLQRRRQQRPSQQQAATLLLQLPWRPTAMLHDSFARQVCSRSKLLDSYARHFHAGRFLRLRSSSFCYCANIYVTINQICLFDNCSMWQPTVFVSMTAIRQQ
jgi:hypothetical protein